jgi:hypothetical protein
MVPADLSAVSKLLNSHLNDHYKVHITFTDAEVGHWLLTREKVIHSWVVEYEKEGITDVMCFYELNSHILNHSEHKILNIAYASYCVAKDNDATRLKQLYKDMLIMSKKMSFDVFNLTEVSQHKQVVDDLMFRVGDSQLKHYF